MSRILLHIALATALILSASPADAQNINASVGGTVNDPSGAVIPNAEVTLKSLATGTISKVTTNESGLFRFPNLQAGAYELSVSATGFRDFVQRGISLSINDTVNIKVLLEPRALIRSAFALDLFSAISNILSEHCERLAFPYDIHHALIIRAWSAGHFDDGIFGKLDGDSFAVSR